MKNYLYWLLPIGWMAVIFRSSATPYQNQDIKPLLGSFPVDLSFLEPLVDWISFRYHQSVVSVETLGIEGFIEFFIRKGAHVGVFFLLMCAFYAALRKAPGLKSRTNLALSFFLTVAYAVADEVHQGFTPNRTPYFGDVVLDSFGALLAAVCLLVFTRWKR
ncbi:VanZ family protein [Virgibacillus xinjiangensis]|uniref:VanZ family protein n=1 Tax=Virgibacillus xinjiangensis TaxID=393090 RepID=A0ABV7CYP6_9BACI